MAIMADSTVHAGIEHQNQPARRAANESLPILDVAGRFRAPAQCQHFVVRWPSSNRSLDWLVRSAALAVAMRSESLDGRIFHLDRSSHNAAGYALVETQQAALSVTHLASTFQFRNVRLPEMFFPERDAGLPGTRVRTRNRIFRQKGDITNIAAQHSDHSAVVNQLQAERIQPIVEQVTELQTEIDDGQE